MATNRPAAQGGTCKYVYEDGSGTCPNDFHSICDQCGLKCCIGHSWNHACPGAAKPTSRVLVIVVLVAVYLVVAFFARWWPFAQ